MAGGVFETPLNNAECINLIRNYAMFGYKVEVGFKVKKINMNLSYVKTNSEEQKTYINGGSLKCEANFPRKPLN